MGIKRENIKLDTLSRIERSSYALGAYAVIFLPAPLCIYLLNHYFKERSWPTYLCYGLAILVGLYIAIFFISRCVEDFFKEIRMWFRLDSYQHIENAAWLAYKEREQSEINGNIRWFLDKDLDGKFLALLNSQHRQEEVIKDISNYLRTAFTIFIMALGSGAVLIAVYLVDQGAK